MANKAIKNGALERKGANPGIVIAMASTTPIAIPATTVTGNDVNRPSMAAENAGITKNVSSVACNLTMFASSKPQTPAKAPDNIQATVST